MIFSTIFVYPLLPISVGDVWRMVEVGAKKKIEHLNDHFHNFCLFPFVNLRGLASGRGWCQINVNEELPITTRLVYLYLYTYILI